MAYSFGVIGVIAFVKLMPQVMRIDIKAEEDLIHQEIKSQNPSVIYHHLLVTNPNLFNQAVKDIQLDRIAPVTITRLLRRNADKSEMVNRETILYEGDRLRVVGTENDLNAVEVLIGKQIEDTIEFEGNMVTRQTLGVVPLYDVYQPKRRQEIHIDSLCSRIAPSGPWI